LIKAPSNEANNIIRLLNELILGVEMFFNIIFSRYDLILITSPPFIASFGGVLAAKVRKIPYIFDVRDEYPEVFFTSKLLNEASIVGKILLKIESFIYKNAFKVITVTDGICKRIDIKIKKKDFAALVRNGFDGTRFTPTNDKEKRFTVVFHGNIGKFQDPDLIISLAQKVNSLGKDIHFKVIGFGGKDASLKNLTPSNLSFLGMVNYENIPSIISRAHVGISFRSNDTISKNSFPVKLYEYIGVGIPVIVTPISEAGDFFSSRGIGYQFDPDQVDLILAKIIELYENSDLRSLITSKIFSVRESFSRQQISNNFAVEIVNLFNQGSIS
jgi:glycosyltransferase involved in cell wall biosynthesis